MQPAPAGHGALHPRVPPLTADLAIYSQLAAWERGEPPTWDSPDISTFRGSDPPVMLPVIEATVRNLSPGVGAFDALVHCDLSTFGLGTPRARLASQVVSFGPGASATVSFPLDPARLGNEAFVGVHFTIEYPRDADPRNNAGSQVLYAYSTRHSGRSISFEFPAHNNSAATRELRLQILPNSLSATIAPTSISIGAHQSVPVTGTLTVPSGALPLERVTIVALDPVGQLIDGLTYAVVVND